MRLKLAYEKNMRFDIDSVKDWYAGGRISILISDELKGYQTSAFMQ